MWNDVVISGKARPHPAGTYSLALCVAPPHPILSPPLLPSTTSPRDPPAAAWTNKNKPPLSKLSRLLQTGGWVEGTFILRQHFFSLSFSFPFCLTPDATATANLRFSQTEWGWCSFLFFLIHLLFFSPLFFIGLLPSSLPPLSPPPSLVWGLFLLLW